MEGLKHSSRTGRHTGAGPRQKERGEGIGERMTKKKRGVTGSRERKEKMVEESEEGRPRKETMTTACWCTKRTLVTDRTTGNKEGTGRVWTRGGSLSLSHRQGRNKHEKRSKRTEKERRRDRPFLRRLVVLNTFSNPLGSRRSASTNDGEKSPGKHRWRVTQGQC